MAGASGQLEAKNDELIKELLKDPDYKIEKGKIYTRRTMNGQGLCDDWREVGYKRSDGYVRFRYKGEFLLMQRVMYQHKNKDLKSDMVINHINLNRSDNSDGNTEMVTQHENNKKKHKKYKKHKKKSELIRRVIGKILGENMKNNTLVERIINSHLDSETFFKEAEEWFNSEVKLEVDESLVAHLAELEVDEIDEVKTKKVKIKWSPSFIYRNWGFNVSISVPDQKIEVDYSHLADAHTDSAEDKSIKISLKDIDVEFEWPKGSDTYRSSGVSPDSLEIDKKGKAILKVYGGPR